MEAVLQGAPAIRGVAGKKVAITAALSLAMLITGASGLVSEYVLSTVSTYILGNSIEQFSITIALMMFMMGTATWFQRFISDVNLVEKFIFGEVILAILIGFSPIVTYASYSYFENHFQLVFYFFASAIGFLIGLEIPLASRINEAYVSSLKINLGLILAFDYVGAFVGAILWVKALLPHFPLTEIGFIMGSANLMVALIFTVFYWRAGKLNLKYTVAAAVIVTALLLGWGFANNRAWDVNLEQRLYESPIVHSETTRYQRMTVTKSKAVGDYRLYLNGNLQFSSKDENIYHDNLVHPAMSLAASREKVLLIGAGDGLALREVRKYQDVKQITLVDLDPDMVEFCATNKVMRELNQNAFADARLKVLEAPVTTEPGKTAPVYIETGEVGKKGRPKVQSIAQVDVYTVDGDKFLSKINERYDVVIVDLPDPNSIELAKLYSKEFYLKLRRVLGPDAVVVVQSTSPYHAKEAYLCILRTIGSAGFQTTAYHDNVPSFGDWGWIMAWPSENGKQAAEAKLANLNSFPVATTYLTPQAFGRNMVFGREWLSTTNKDVSTLMRPVVLDYYVRQGWLIE